MILPPFANITLFEAASDGNAIVGGVRMMEIKSFAATLGVGILAGAATMLMIPKQSSVYKAADDAAMTVKRGVTHAVENMKQ